MKQIAWDRKARIVEVREQIWAYVSPASYLEGPGLLVAAALLNWPQDEAARLGHLQFLLSDEVGTFLDDMPRQVRKLATEAERHERQSSERIEGPVSWSRTQALRGTSGNQSSFVTLPAERVYQTPENELMVHVLDTIVETAALTGWDKKVKLKGLAKLVRNRKNAAIRFRQHQVLTGIDRVSPTPRALARIRSGRNRQRYASTLAAYDRAVYLVERADRQAIREAIEQAGIVTSVESTLFELLTTFRLIDSLKQNGWRMEPFYIFEGKVRSHGVRQDGREIWLWYQTTPSELTMQSRYKGALSAHQFASIQDLRPDLTLKWQNQGGSPRWLLFECKLSQSGDVAATARRALVDLLAYRRSFEDVLGGGGTPYGVGVAWGEGLQPAHDAEVMLCTPDTLASVISAIVT